MKRVFLALTLVVSLSLVNSAAVSVYAQQTSPPPAATPATDPKAELKARLEQRKESLKTKLNAADSKRVSARCVAAQGKLAAVTKKVEESNQPYKTRYEAFVKKLESLRDKLDAEGKNTTDLNGQINTLKQQYQAHQAAVDKLKLSVADLQAVDCKADPTAFKATLEDARAQLKTAQTTRKDLNTYIKDTLRKTIQTFKSNQAGSN